MSKESPKKHPSAFDEFGFKSTVDSLLQEIRLLYTLDGIPWVIGYSGGKDSTAIVQLVWMALQGLPPEQRRKKVFVISTDTWVESPIVSGWVRQSLVRLRQAALQQKLPLEPHLLEPILKDSFWVNLIGKGYPAPRNQFRWCTERLKIRPANEFIKRVVQESGEAILVLGTRKAESAKRHGTMNKHGANRVRERLTPNSNLPNSLIFTPIEDWSNDDVWVFLMQLSNQWGHSHNDLLTMYRGATADGECPLVVDTSTPSCGSSRFGCWICTLVDRDRSMEAMIQNDEEKEWMLPLLNIRNMMDPRVADGKEDDRHRREWRRMSGAVNVMDRVIDGVRYVDTVPGPYTKKWRETWLTMLLEAQQEIRKFGPPAVRDIELIRDEELHEIRRIWVNDKCEFDDSLPRIYEKVTGTPFKAQRDDGVTLGGMEWNLLEKSCNGNEMRFELITRLLSVEREYSGMGSRRGLYDALKKCLDIAGFESKDEAIEEATERRGLREGKLRPGRNAMVTAK